MDRRSFLKLFAAAGPVAVVAPKYFFAPVGGWHSDVIVHPSDPTSCESVNAARNLSRMLMVSNPTSPDYWVKERFIGADFGKGGDYSVYWLRRDGKIYQFDGSEPPVPMNAEWSAAPRANPRRGLMNAAS